ncbi:MAG: hypothetical protein WAW57_15390 [Lutibacter sp.]
MLKLKTKSEKTVPFGRTTKQAIVHLIIDNLNVNRNNVIGTGYYYYYDDNGQVVRLSDINTLTELALFEQIENNFLPPLNSTQNVFVNVLQRLKETTLMNIAQENGESYGILENDLEDE